METHLPTQAEPVFGRLFLAIRRAAQQFFADGALTSGAAMSFYLALCLAPLVLVTLAVTKMVWGEPMASQEVVRQAQQFVGVKGAQTINKMIAESNTPDTGMVSLFTGLLVGLFGATGVFVQLQQTLDCIYQVAPDPNRSRAQMLWDRLVSIVLVVLIGFMLLVSVLVTAGLAAARISLQARLSADTWIWAALDFLVSLAIVSFLFGFMFKFLPHTQISWRKVWLGAIVTALLFNIGKSLTAIYIGCSSVDSASEAAGAIVVIVIWEYYSSLAIFFGAELTQTYTRASERVCAAQPPEPA